jgi:hypothetical protein
MREKRDACSVVVGIPEWKKPLGRPKRRWENDIQVACKGLG